MRVLLAAAAVLLVSGCGSTPITLAAQHEPAPAVTVAPPPTVTKVVVQRAPIAYATRTVRDATLAHGVHQVRTSGRTGTRTRTFRVTFTDGVQTHRTLLSSVVTRKPIDRVIALGTRPAVAAGCDPNYTPCVPIASDVDCAGGSGNGPAYVVGPVTVIGTDVYDLDRDGDGTGCED